MSDKFMKIKELLEKKTGRKAVIKKMVKNNGTSYTGIFVEFESTNTLPVINLDAFYDECNAQKLSIDEITDKIIAVLNENTSENFNTEAFTNFSLAKDRIIMQLINKTRNQELLSDVPYIDFWDDLVLIFKYNLSAGYENQANITIHKNHMDEWGADVDTLYRLAQKATEHNYHLIVFPAQWDEFGKKAGFIRNEQMHRYIASKQDRGVIAFWDGESKGTFQSFDLSKKYNNQIRVIKYKNIEK